LFSIFFSSIFRVCFRCGIKYIIEILANGIHPSILINFIVFGSLKSFKLEKLIHNIADEKTQLIEKHKPDKENIGINVLLCNKLIKTTIIAIKPINEKITNQKIQFKYLTTASLFSKFLCKGV
jgi:hypothetical protein